MREHTMLHLAQLEVYWTIVHNDVNMAALPYFLCYA